MVRVLGEGGPRWSRGWIAATAALVVLALAGSLFGYRLLVPPAHSAHDIAAGSWVGESELTPVPAEGVTGSFTIDCGRNAEAQHNADNVVLNPGMVGGAHHIHDYVGNKSTTALSTDQSLAAAGTTCAGGDRSTYYWPVLRVPDGSELGRIVIPDAVRIGYHGVPGASVVEMPPFLRAATGNPHGVTQDGAGTEHVRWTCSGARDRVTRKYPRCARGEQVIRVFDFPNCWNGRTTDSADHRSHLVFADASGRCAVGTFPVPRLRVEVAYSLPDGIDYAIDSFPEEHRDPSTDHAAYIDLLPGSLSGEIVACLNSGRTCRA